MNDEESRLQHIKDAEKTLKLSVEIQKSEDKIYKISGEWGLDEIQLKINTPYYSYFWDVSDGYLNGEQGY